jgi:hypothetical protein
VFLIGDVSALAAVLRNIMTQRPPLQMIEKKPNPYSIEGFEAAVEEIASSRRKSAIFLRPGKI